ncbi:MAG TPA: hypothetical protein VK324_06105 [Tepidisphaeraceae bacterium]|nr:hypothetical protein [Tepidisphaeraceae bacterium]
MRGDAVPRSQLAMFSVDLPPGWADVTADVKAHDPPPTFTPHGGVGALQFSIAVYRSGRRPTPDVVSLQQLLDDFARGRGFVSPRDPVRR